jgi:MFS family permease
LVILAALASLLFALLLLASTFAPMILLILLSMVSWGIYYEFLGFARQQFVANSIPAKLHASVWAFMFTFRSLAYTVGPFVAGYILENGARNLLYVSIAATIAGYLFILVSGVTKHSGPVNLDLKHINFGAELTHWQSLLRHVWPIVLLSLLMGIVDAAFWTTGAVYSGHLSKSSFLGRLFVPAYMFPSLFIGFLIIKWKVEEGKKRKALWFFTISSIFLSLIGLFESVFAIVVLVLVSSLLSSFTYPLVDGVYSDIIARMGRQRLHLVGLTNSATSLAYIIGPVIAGFTASLLGEKMTFSVIGMFSVVVSVLLLVATPKKLHLPQSEIRHWK